MPTIRNPFTNKPTSGLIEEENERREHALENDNYHNEFVSPFSVTDESEESSAITPSPRDQEDGEGRSRGGPGAMLDRLRSGVSNTRGFERF